MLAGWVTAQVVPPGPPGFDERPVAAGVLLGGVLALPLLIVDLTRRPRRRWVWGLVLGGLILSWSAWSGTFGEDSDIDQILAWGFMLGTFVAAPLIASSVIEWAWTKGREVFDRRPRRWGADVRNQSIEFTRPTGCGRLARPLGARASWWC